MMEREQTTLGKILQTYEDDTIILLTSRECNSFEQLIDKQDASREQYGMKLNARKTKTRSYLVEKTQGKKCDEM